MSEEQKVKKALITGITGQDGRFVTAAFYCLLSSQNNMYATDVWLGLRGQLCYVFVSALFSSASF